MKTVILTGACLALLSGTVLADDDILNLPFATTSNVTEHKKSVPKPPPGVTPASRASLPQAHPTAEKRAAVAKPAPAKKAPKVAAAPVVQKKKQPKRRPTTFLDLPLPGTNGRIRDGGLPGLGVPPDMPPAINPKVINITNGVTEVLTVSKLMPNRIATPYKKPQVIDASGADIQTIGSNVYILPKDDKPFGIFITDEENDLPVASLTLIPKGTPSQNILLQIDRRVTNYSAPEDKKMPTPEEYTRKLVFILRKAMTGHIPEGFVVASINVGQIRIGPVIGMPDKRWSSSKLDIYRYKLTNNGEETVELTEPSFYESGVKAVSFGANGTRLNPGEYTYAYIVSGNTASSVFQKNSPVLELAR
ncbi:hypothetical protein [Thiolapillus sp.]|uniref:hypothetical protein n=1 Tax=Thiolapillus sp. TaxID=2017437 RepID=UPI003AF9B084